MGSSKPEVQRLAGFLARGLRSSQDYDPLGECAFHSTAESLSLLFPPSVNSTGAGASARNLECCLLVLGHRGIWIELPLSMRVGIWEEARVRFSVRSILCTDPIFPACGSLSCVCTDAENIRFTVFAVFGRKS
jgi:hypothetical protein